VRHLEQPREMAGAVEPPLYYQGARPTVTAPASSVVLLERFPPRVVPATWAMTRRSAQQLAIRLAAAPFTAASASLQQDRRRGLELVLGWLGQQPGDSWQERWIASGADAEGNGAWRELPARWASSVGQGPTNAEHAWLTIGRGMLLLICGDVIRPSLGWLLTPATARKLSAEIARTRDPEGFASLAAVGQADVVNAHTLQLALRRVATILAAKGGVVADIRVGDCLELLRIADDLQGHGATSPYFYQLLRSTGVLDGGAPPTARALRTQGQLGCEQLIDRYDIQCGPVRDLLVDYLKERQPAVDYSTLHKLSYTLARLFWRDLELHHPGIDSLQLPTEVATGWKQRIATKTTRTRTADGMSCEVAATRINAVDHMMMVRAFYLDLTQWATGDPARWGPWVAPCPIRDTDVAQHKKARSRRKSRMDQRTRERLPILPVLLAAVDTERKATSERLHAARATDPGQLFTAGGLTLRRTATTHASVGRIWAEDPTSSRRRDLGQEERQAFWTWAAVEVLRHTGVRIEELTELSHHSFINYKLPTTGELIPLLQIAPSKTDTERLVVISPELADVLSAVICRIREDDGAVPLVVAYDYHERVWNPPMPLLFQRRYAGEHRPIGGPAVRGLLNDALAGTGLTDNDGRPLRFVPHDFRRLFITDAVMNGMPPHIAQLVAGHRDISVTMGYKAIYPEEAINAHRAFIARRRSLRPAEEYRIPTDEEWDEFLGHFQRRKVSLGTCGRSYNTSCIHEHACIRCPLLRPDPAHRGRLVEICDNLAVRIDEAQRHGWVGEVDGLNVSLAAAKHKLAQMDDITTRRHTIVPLGLPRLGDLTGRTTTTDPLHSGNEPS
jgi:hypothetical protein